MKKYLFILPFLALAACHNAKKTHVDQPVSTEQETGNMRFIVSFISIGSGTDREAIRQFEAYVLKFEEKNKVKLNVQKTNWGREGEIDYCFKLSEVKAKQQEAFIEETKELLKNSTRVRYMENSPCKNPGKVIPKNPLPKE